MLPDTQFLADGIQLLLKLGVVCQHFCADLLAISQCFCCEMAADPNGFFLCVGDEQML